MDTAELTSGARGLADIDPEAARAFDLEKGLLMDLVNRALLAHDRLPNLIGSLEQTPMMLDNHRNHALFMASVFHLNAWPMLARILPWVYRTYLRHGFHPDYFLEELSAWKRAACEELPRPYAEQICDVYDWMLVHHDAVVALAREESSPHPVGGGEPKPWQTFLDAVLERNVEKAIGIADGLVGAAADLPVFYQETVLPTMYEVGAQWERGSLTVAQEHMATAVAETVISSVYSRLPLPPPSRGRAIVSAAPSELHEMGARTIAHSLETDGWDVAYLGGNTPILDLVDVAMSLRPSFVAVSVAMPFHLHLVKDLVQKLRDGDLRNTPVLVGGLAFHLIPEAIETLPDVFYAADCREAIRHAREFSATGLETMHNG